MTDHFDGFGLGPISGASSAGETGDLILQELDGLAADWKTADLFSDKDLKPQIVHDRREQLKAEAAQARTASILALADETTEDANAARAACTALEFDARTIADTTAESEWRFNLLPALAAEQVQDWQGLISSASPEALAAIDRFAPAWIRLNIKAPGLSKAMKDNEAAAVTADVKAMAKVRGIELNGGTAALAAQRSAEATERAAQRVAGEFRSGRVRSATQLVPMSMSLKTAKLFG